MAHYALQGSFLLRVWSFELSEILHTMPMPRLLKVILTTYNLFVIHTTLMNVSKAPLDDLLLFHIIKQTRVQDLARTPAGLEVRGVDNGETEAARGI